MPEATPAPRMRVKVKEMLRPRRVMMKISGLEVLVGQ